MSFFELEPKNSYQFNNNFPRDTTAFLKPSTCEENSDSESEDYNYNSLIKYLAKEEVKMVGEDYAKSFIELLGMKTVEEFDEYIHRPAPDILRNAEKSQTRKKIMHIFFNLKKEMEQDFHENGRGYIPSKLAEAIDHGLFKNLKKLILPYPKHLLGALFDEKAAIGWMRKILPGINAIFAA